jgi:hypothetical protein
MRRRGDADGSAYMEKMFAQWKAERGKQTPISRG